MTSAELNAFKQRQPFRPFMVTMLDDEAYAVTQPGLMLVAGDDVLIGFSDSKDPYPIAHDCVFLSLQSIAKAEVVE
jgi:hypothetical protein